MPNHYGTIHFEDSVQQVYATHKAVRYSFKCRRLTSLLELQIEDAFLDAQHGFSSKRPVIEMNLPTSLDSTIAPPGTDACTTITQTCAFLSQNCKPTGKHIALLFVQYTPYEPKVSIHLRHLLDVAKC
jgi:hypothetical protein